eukprot:7527732-Pyramimonas_sp.AAC.1
MRMVRVKGRTRMGDGEGARSEMGGGRSPIDLLTLPSLTSADTRLACPWRYVARGVFAAQCKALQVVAMTR